MAILGGGVAQVVLNGGGVVEQGTALRGGPFKFFLDLASHVVVGDPAALPLHPLHILDKDRGVRPQPLEDVFPVVEPGIPGMKIGGLIAVGPKNSEQTVQIPVHNPHGGGGGAGQGIRLHSRHHVKLRIGGAAGKARHNDVPC